VSARKQTIFEKMEISPARLHGDGQKESISNLLCFLADTN